ALSLSGRFRVSVATPSATPNRIVSHAILSSLQAPTTAYRFGTAAQIPGLTNHASVPPPRAYGCMSGVCRPPQFPGFLSRLVPGRLGAKRRERDEEIGLMQLVADRGAPLEREQWAARYNEVRAYTETLAAPLSAEDQTVQSKPRCGWRRPTPANARSS